MMMIAMTKRLSGRVEALTRIVEKSRGLDFNHMRDPQEHDAHQSGLIVVALLVAWPPHVNAEEPAPILLEAIILDETCNPSCIGEQPSHVVEFFSADWCDPCRSVESMLRNGTHQEDQVLILTHHPSPADASFLSYSYLRQTRTYRLVGIPNLVVDGAELLSGDRQGLELDEVLDRRANITLDSEIMSDIELVDGNMTWSPVHEGVVHLLRIEDHVGPEGLVPNLITNGTSGNEMGAWPCPRGWPACAPVRGGGASESRPWFGSTAPGWA